LSAGLGTLSLVLHVVLDLAGRAFLQPGGLFTAGAPHQSGLFTAGAHQRGGLYTAGEPQRGGIYTAAVGTKAQDVGMKASPQWVLAGCIFRGYG
jgi:hypothetical protein